jgi:hypothetical protein
MRLSLLLCLAGCALGQTSQIISTPSTSATSCTVVNNTVVCPPPPPAWTPSISISDNIAFPHNIEIPPHWCDGTLKMGSSTRAIKDVFPDECGVKKSAYMDSGPAEHQYYDSDGNLRVSGGTGAGDPQDNTPKCSIGPLHEKGNLPIVCPGGVNFHGDFATPPVGTVIGLPYNSVDCDNANGNPKLCTVEADAPEPEDVLAIQEPHQQCINDSNVCLSPAGSSCPCGHYDSVPMPTCADKSRIMERAEDGKLWCHKPQTEVEDNCHIERYWADLPKGDLGPIIGDPPHGWIPVGDLRIVCRKETK